MWLVLKFEVVEFAILDNFLSRSIEVSNFGWLSVSINKSYIFGDFLIFASSK